MKTQHVRSDLWRQTLDDVSRAQPEVVDRPLRGVSSDRGGVTIRLAEPAGTSSTSSCIRRMLRIVETDEGAVMAVEMA